jgi:hypothetical protein
MQKELISMSHSEVNRLNIVQSLIQKRLYQAKAAMALALSTRQIKRLVRGFKIRRAFFFSLQASWPTQQACPYRGFQGGSATCYTRAIR